MTLREYKKEDALSIVSWIKSERELKLWSTDRYNTFPLTPLDINSFYEFCLTTDKIYPYTLVDDNKVVGHFILRIPDKNTPSTLRLGFVIINSSLRGRGYGKALMAEAIKCAHDTLNAKKLTLEVFINNTSAYNCYKKCGFNETKVFKNAFKFHDELWSFSEMELNL